MKEVRLGGEEKPEREEVVEPLVEPNPARRRERPEGPEPHEVPEESPEEAPARATHPRRGFPALHAPRRGDLVGARAARAPTAVKPSPA